MSYPPLMSCSIFILTVSQLVAAPVKNIAGPPGSGSFGASVTVLPGGNVVITDPLFDDGPVTDAGAVFLYDGVTYELISRLTGSADHDQVGSDGITVLKNGNYTVKSSGWGGGVGAVTWCSGMAGLNGPVSAGNSILGSALGDLLNPPLSGTSLISVTPLANGNYIVSAPAWDNGAARNAGAVIWGDGTQGTSGVISSENALVGSVENDLVGGGYNSVIALPGGNAVVGSPSWRGRRGAHTWIDGAKGVRGILSSANSLVGSTERDDIGGDVLLLANGNYLVLSRLWDNGTSEDAGAVTWGSAAGGVKGVLSAANSLVGTSTRDWVGEVVIMPNGNYLVSSPSWDNSSIPDPDRHSDRLEDAGAVTWASSSSGVAGAVSSANSLVGGTAFETLGAYTGFEQITFLTNGNYVVSGTNSATLGNGQTGVRGTVSSSISLMSGRRVTALKNGNYVVSDFGWAPPYPASSRGAVTWCDGVKGRTGFVSSANSLVGGQNEDMVGSGGVFPLSNGSFVICSPDWINNGAASAGAITWASGTGPVTGTVSASNSLVGSREYDMVGGRGVIELSNGNFLIRSPGWDHAKGAVTWGSRNFGVIGEISSLNSLVGTTSGDSIGITDENDVWITAAPGFIQLKNGHYVIRSPRWSNGGNKNAGAVTWGNGDTGIAGEISAANSLIGSSADDKIGGGWGGGVKALENGAYVVMSREWDHQKGAVTWGDGAAGVTGIVSAANSLTGGTSGDYVGTVTPLKNGNYLVSSPEWSHGASSSAGAVTWGSGAEGVTGMVSASNSLVGSTAGDQVGHRVATLPNGGYVTATGSWNNGSISDTGAVTWGDGNGMRAGAVSPSNSLVGDAAGDMVGGSNNVISTGVVWIKVLNNGNFLIRSPLWHAGRGAVTWSQQSYGGTGPVSASNSLLGGTPGDSVGSEEIDSFADGTYLVRSRLWDNGAVADAGFVILGNQDNGLTGLVTGLNGVVGTARNGGVISGFYDAATAKAVLPAPGANTVGVFDYSAELTITDAAGVIVSGNSPPSPASHTDFGMMRISRSSSPRYFLICCTGAFPMNLTGVPPVSVGGPQASDFTVITQPSGPVPAGGATNFGVSFTPGAPGLRSATITIVSDARKGSPFTFAVQGRGIDSAIFENWSREAFGSAAAGIGNLEDFDRDGVLNLMEFAFGTLPGNQASGPSPLKYDGALSGGGNLSATGQPVLMRDGTTFRALFARRTDYLDAGLKYTPQFARDLTHWEDITPEPVVLADNGQHQVASVILPDTEPLQPAQFFRVKVEIVP